MNTSLTITNIYGVYEGAFNPGFIPRKKIGRHSDCFVYFIEGEIEYIFDTQIIKAETDSMLYLAKDSIYDINVKKSCKHIFVDFDFEKTSDKQKCCVFKNTSSLTKSEFTKLFYLWNKKNLWYMQSSFSVLYNLHAEAIKAENKNYFKQNKLFSKTASYILENYSSPAINVTDIANHAGISEVHLRRIFKSAVNTTPVKYINYLRLEKAKNMLINSNYSVNEIAFSVGFEDAYYFSRLFKKEIGISPSEYKKTN